jgi:hypothetical protein
MLPDIPRFACLTSKSKGGIMETQTSTDKPVKRAKSGSKPKEKSSLKKINLDTAKVITQIRDKANKKDYGRKVRDSEVLAMAVSLITDKEIELLKEATYSEQDRLKMAHADYIKNSGSKVSLDDFIGKLLRGEINQNTL